jgi:uncharacterized protein YegL
MRRLPIYFVLDVSESMVGENLKKLEDGINGIIKTLRQDPNALETVHVGVIAFAGVAKTIVPLIEVPSFYSPKLPIGGGTSLGAALNHLMDELDRSLIKTTVDHKGDWKPIIYLLTDGKPTDSVGAAISRWKSNYANHATFVAVALGKFADVGLLKQITENAFLLEDTSDDVFKKFITWVTDSVKSQSLSVNDIASENSNLAKIDENILSLIKDISHLKPVDEDYVIINGRCQNTKLPYLMKYERHTQEISHQDFNLNATHYMVAGCYPVGDDYFEWSAGSQSQLRINTSELLGSPGCPHCGNKSAFGVCACGGIMCLNGPENAKCPWCMKEVEFSNEGTEEGFDVNRARG